ncbi:SDR family NAD(P)-dependent oxidoreductase [Paraferrimonas sp. SM1919]|uniref:SDR family NAD(P)-dependent oxidoreductase n=1 Tax=Paraferrimonas sp. SM1919 TaxID=2662263 RepID=UPI0013D3BC94|nr:SDR family oxidoreductase [Paraferrimonas sp. SM1919]
MNKLLVITGASSGIGLACAQHFIEQGYRVINISRKPCPMESDKLQHLSLDLSQGQWPQLIINQLIQAAAAANQICLIHNAAVLNKDCLAQVDIDSFRHALELNVIAPERLNQILLAYMKPGSSILYVGSTLSEQAVAGSYTYVTSKHANLGMMRATCQDLQSRYMAQGIHTAMVCPGFTDTPMLNRHVGDRQLLESIACNNGFHRLVDPTEIANTLYFCSQNPVINGSVIHANLGQKQV